MELLEPFAYMLYWFHVETKTAEEEAELFFWILTIFEFGVVFDQSQIFLLCPAYLL
jgi:hypothetical protein